MRKDPQQELFAKVRKELEKRFGRIVFDGAIPSKEVGYPFIYMAGSTQTDTQNKTALFGTVSQTIHVWYNNLLQRGTFSTMLLDIKEIARGIEATENRSWNLVDINQTIMEDNTTAHALMHGILEFTWTFS
jgi:hypothetical protein